MNGQMKQAFLAVALAVAVMMLCAATGNQVLETGGTLAAIAGLIIWGRRSGRSGRPDEIRNPNTLLR